MNKELIKQLEGVGFEERKNYEGCFRLRLKKYYHFDYYDDDTFYCYFEGDYVEGLKGSYDSPTFPQVLAAIKEHTGVDLTKKTKHEEIEELKVRLGKMQGAIKSQDEAIEGLKGCISPTKRKYFFGLDYGLDAADALAYSVNQMIRKDVNKLIEQGDERILSKLKPIDTSKLKQAIKNMQGMFDKQASEMQAEEKKAFEVGDRVIKKGDGAYFKNGVKLIIKGKKTDHNCYWCQSESMPIVEKYVHERNLEHAPAESPKETSITEVLENVLYWDTCSEEYKCVIKKYLEESKESPKEKVLEFSKYAEILEGHPSKTSYCKGVDVLIIDDTGRPNVTVVMNGHYPVDIHESNLKPL